MDKPSRNKPINRDLLTQTGHNYYDDTVIRNSKNLSRTLPEPDVDNDIQDAIASKLVALEDHHYNQVLASSNVSKPISGFITCSYFEANPISANNFYAYGIPLSGDYIGALAGSGTSRLSGYTEAGALATTNNSVSYWLGGFHQNDFITPYDNCYIDRIEVGLSITHQIGTDHGGQPYMISIAAGSQADPTDMADAVSAGWFSDLTFDGDDVVISPFGSGENYFSVKGRFRQNNNQSERAVGHIVPVSTTLTDYDDKYFYLTDGKGQRVKFIFDKDSGSVTRTSATEYRVGISGSSNVADLCDDIEAALKTCGADNDELRIYSIDKSTHVYIANMTPGSHGNNIIETDLGTSVLKFTDSGLSTAIQGMTGGVDYDPYNNVIGSEALPSNIWHKHPIMQRENNTEDLAKALAFDKVGDGESNAMGLQYHGRLVSSYPLYFPNTLTSFAYTYHARVSIDVKSIFKYQGTPVKVVLHYAGDAVHNDLDEGAASVSDQAIYTQARVIGGRM